MEATVVFIFSEKREKAPASTSFFDAPLSSDGAQSLSFVCMRGRDGAEEKATFFRLPSVQNIHVVLSACRSGREIYGRKLAPLFLSLSGFIFIFDHCGFGCRQEMSVSRKSSQSLLDLSGIMNRSYSGSSICTFTLSDNSLAQSQMKNMSDVSDKQ